MTKEALKSAIEFAEYCLEELDLSYMASNQAKRLVEKAKEALAQPEQEPVACANGCKGFFKCTPPPRKPLTREVIDRDFYGRVDFVRQIEAAHGIKE